MQDDHRAHCPAGVVEEPVVGGPVLDRIPIFGTTILGYLAKQGFGVVAVEGDGILRDLLKLDRVENELFVEVAVEEVEDW